MRTMGETIKLLRLERNLSQEQFAKILNVAPSTVGMWENNKRFPNEDTKEAIADYFNVDMNYLYGKTPIRNSYRDIIQLDKTNMSPLNKQSEISGKNFAVRLQKALDYKNKKASDLAKGTGLSQALISQYLKGKFDAKNDKIAIIADYLKVNELYLAGFSDEMVQSQTKEIAHSLDKSLPIFESISTEYPRIDTLNSIGKEELPNEITYPDDYFALLDKGNTMMPFKGIQHIVIAKKQDYAEDGDIAVILIDDNDAIIRQVKKDKGLMILKAKDPEIDDLYFTEDEMKKHKLRIIGVVEISRIHW